LLYFYFRALEPLELKYCKTTFVVFCYYVLGGHQIENLHNKQNKQTNIRILRVKKFTYVLTLIEPLGYFNDLKEANVK